MANRLTAQIETDPAALAEDAFAYIEGAIPGWTAAPANIDTLIVEALSEEAALAADVAAGATDAVFRAFGPIAGIPALEAVAATATFRFTFVGTAGYTIPANTTVGLRDADYQLRGFAVPNDVIVPPATASVDLLAYALEDGADSSGLTGTVEPITVPAFVASVSIVGTSTGGADAEGDKVFLSRLAETLTLASPRPILPNDFAVLARTVPGIYRAAAVDLLKPSSTSGASPTPAGAESTGNARTVTVAVTDVNGADPGVTPRAAVATYLASEREVNFLVYVVAALYRTIAVTTTVKVWTGQNTATVSAAVQQAIRDYLNPATYATGPDSDPRVWENEPLVSIDALYDVIRSVDGVRKVTALTFGPSGGSMGTADVDLASGSLRPALPTTAAGTTAGVGINVTATA